MNNRRFLLYNVVKEPEWVGISEVLVGDKILSIKSNFENSYYDYYDSYTNLSEWSRSVYVSMEFPVTYKNVYRDNTNQFTWGAWMFVQDDTDGNIRWLACGKSGYFYPVSAGTHYMFVNAPNVYSPEYKMIKNKKKSGNDYVLNPHESTYGMYTVTFATQPEVYAVKDEGSKQRPTTFYGEVTEQDYDIDFYYKALVQR